MKNVDLWKALDALAALHQIEWRWVKGHAGHEGNERADALANRASTSCSRLLEESPPWKPNRRARAAQHGPAAHHRRAVGRDLPPAERLDALKAALERIARRVEEPGLVDVKQQDKPPHY